MDLQNNNELEQELILLVDDDAINLRLFAEYLLPYYRIKVVTSGEKALQIANEDLKPDLILLDVMMPGVDGFSVLKSLKANPKTSEIPVIFLTALNAIEQEGKGLALGAADYISKPCNLPILLARVRTQLELKKSREILKNKNEYLEAELQRRQQETQQMHLQLMQSEKMAAIGQLAAGVAHEINNPIGYVSSNLSTLSVYLQRFFEILDAYETIINQTSLPTEVSDPLSELKEQKDFLYIREEIPQILDETREGLNRVKYIVKDLKSFSHADENHWEWVDLIGGLDSTINIVWNELKYHCLIHKEYKEIPMVYGLASQLNQVFMNLLVNAAHAIKAKGNGDITIRVGNTEQEVWVEIADNGEGITPENLPKLFQPFFTTKPVGKGTGLGLSISQSIIEKHGGRINVASEHGTGTTFRVSLPIQLQRPEPSSNAQDGTT